MTEHNSTIPPFARWVSDAAQAWFAENIAGATAPPGDLAVVRAHYDAINGARLTTALDAFAVEIEHSMLAGVPVAIVTPAGGAIDDTVLLCLHGGAFMWGRGAGALIEAAPIAAVTGRTVIAVGYRLAPGHLFPAAVDDVLACYTALLEERSSRSIGVYGCSAGGMLTAQMVARLIADDMALPGALVMLHATGLELGGDSLSLTPVLNGIATSDVVPSLHSLPFLADTDPNDRLVFPGDHPAVLAHFPHRC